MKPHLNNDKISTRHSDYMIFIHIIPESEEGGITGACFFFLRSLNQEVTPAKYIALLDCGTPEMSF